MGRNVPVNMDGDRILVFVPMYNCARQIPRVLARFDDRAKSLVHGLLVVDNRSTDGGGEIAAAIVAGMTGIEARVVRNDENYGLGGSHKVAFDHAMAQGYRYVVVLHGDDQGGIDDLLPLLEQGVHHDVDALLGARFHPDSRLQGYSALRTWGNRVLNRLFGMAIGARVRDLGSGLNLYSTRILHNRFYGKFPDDLTFNYCMVLAHAAYRHRVRFFPITWREEDQVSNVRLYSQTRKILRILTGYVEDPSVFLAAEHRAVIRQGYSAQPVDRAR